MPNALTGDFDVVAEFAIAAANRVLAAMHRSERFLHSLAVRVDDNPPEDSARARPTMVGSVDAFGDPVVDHDRIGRPNPFPGILAATDPVRAGLDQVLNPDAGADPEPIQPSHLQGRAQLQLTPPTVEVPDAGGTNVTVRQQIMARYFPDSNTSPAAEFVHGELQITAAVSRIASQAADILNIDVKADDVYVNFTPAWSSHPLTAEDLAAINLLIRNALKTSFLPSTATLPANVAAIQFKTLIGPPGALCLLMNMTGPSGSPASMNVPFLGPGDDFAVAVSVDFVRAALQPIIDRVLAQTFPPITIPVDVFFATYHVVYSIALTGATVDLQDGVILLTVRGHATQMSHKWYAPDSFHFTAKLTFTLSANGDSADLIPGDVSLDTSSWSVNLFRDSATENMRQVRDQALAESGTADTVRQKLSANANLGGLLQSLMPPPPGRRRTGSYLHGFQLAYTSCEIRTAGIIVHGSLGVTDWPPAHVEFEQVPGTSGGDVLAAHGADYSALKTWIPGGAIRRYEWSFEGQPQPFLVDDNKFVLMAGQPAVVVNAASSGLIAGFSPLCLRVRGTRLSSSGPVVQEAVVGESCGFSVFPVINSESVASNDALPIIALTQRGTRGDLVVAGHVGAQVAATSAGCPNRLVHFADDRTATSMDFLTQALRESGRTDAMTAIVAVMAPPQLARAGYVVGVTYAEEPGGTWERIFGVRGGSRPVTLIVAPNGNVVWKQEGNVAVAALAGALRRYLVRCGPVTLRMPRTTVRIGHVSPDFLFEAAPGHALTLRKLCGRTTTLIFWRSRSRPSIEALRDLQQAPGRATGEKPVVLAINDGEPPELARKVAAENGVSATVVADPNRVISSAYGVEIWPTIVSLDASGPVSGIRYGRVRGHVAGTASRPTD